MLPSAQAWPCRFGSKSFPFFIVVRMSRFTKILILLFLVATSTASAQFTSIYYLCDSAVSTPYCPEGKPNSTLVASIPGRGTKMFWGSILMDSAKKHLGRYQKKTEIVLKSGKRRTLKNFSMSPRGLSTTKGSLGFSGNPDTIRFEEISSFYVEGKYDPKASLFLGAYLGGCGLIFGAVFDGLQYAGNRNTNLAPTIGTGVVGGVLGTVLGYFARDGLRIYIQPVVLDTNQVPY